MVVSRHSATHIALGNDTDQFVIVGTLNYGRATAA